jgi:hypothetical protein
VYLSAFFIACFFFKLFSVWIDEEEESGRLIFGSSLGYPFTDLSFGVPALNAATIYSNMFLPENVSKYTSLKG